MGTLGKARDHQEIPGSGSLLKLAHLRAEDFFRSLCHGLAAFQQE